MPITRQLELSGGGAAGYVRGGSKVTERLVFMRLPSQFQPNMIKTARNNAGVCLATQKFI
ncbi:hypothetical protein DTJ06_07070 [Parasaccharibacter sp. TMW 2.1886]|nr:hypothetical protein [Parasaccharibacter sp. TMW 2.1886]